MIEKQTSLNEILVRFLPDGSVKGSQSIRLEQVVDTESGEVLSEKYLPAQPLQASQIETLVGASSAAMIEQIAKLEADLAAAEEAVTERDTLAARVKELEAQLNPVNENGVPTSVTMAQARIALAQAGLLAGVDAAIAGMPEPNKTVAASAWEYSPYISRDSAFVASLGAALGLTDEQVDQLFIAAWAIDL